MKRLAVYRSGKVAGYAIVDDDMAWLAEHRWTMTGGPRGGYAQNHNLGMMHRVVMSVPKGDPRQVDHIDRRPLNNRRANLRVTTRQGNGENSSAHRNSTSRHRGVCIHKASGKWQAYGKRKGEKQVHLGYFADEADAARAARSWRQTNMPNSTD